MLRGILCLVALAALVVLGAVADRHWLAGGVAAQAHAAWAAALGWLGGGRGRWVYVYFPLVTALFAWGSLYAGIHRSAPEAPLRRLKSHMFLGTRAFLYWGVFSLLALALYQIVEPQGAWVAPSIPVFLACAAALALERGRFEFAGFQLDQLYDASVWLRSLVEADVAERLTEEERLDRYETARCLSRLPQTELLRIAVLVGLNPQQLGTVSVEHLARQIVAGNDAVAKRECPPWWRRLR